jgi:CRISPR/Cas system-associated exonuclease Cas4 (RecB family)
VIYDRSTILSLRLRSSVQLRRLTRKEMLTRLQILRTVEPITQKAYSTALWRKHSEQTDEAPHGYPWHVSFHASQFPGDDPMACSRQSLYRMMDFVPDLPPSRLLSVTASAGKAIEVELVKTWEMAGILISAPPDSPTQTNFEIPEARFTGSVDSVILPPGWRKPLPVEVKSKFQREIDKMSVGSRGPDPAHVVQIKAQLGFVRRFQHELWPDLEPVTHGIIFYLSRDNPVYTAEYRVDYDEKFFESGVARLKEWAGLFDEDVLPSPHLGSKHPMGWRWSYPPCQFCPFKKICKLDHEQKIYSLTESVGVDRTQRIRPYYDPKTARERVRARWSGAKIPPYTRVSDRRPAIGSPEHRS